MCGPLCSSRSQARHLAVAVDSPPPLGSVAIMPDGGQWLIVLNRPARAETLLVCMDRAQAVAQAGELAALLDLPLLAVGAEPEEASGAPIPLKVR